jgi:hypothetical protein
MPTIVPVAVLLTLLASVAAICLLLRAGLPVCRRAIESRHWPRVDGLVESVHEVVHRARGEGFDENGREFRVRFYYVVAGEGRSGMWTSLISSRNKQGGCPFKEGEVVDVFYDPLNPGTARLFRGLTLRDAFPLVGAVIFALSSGVPIVAYLLSK